MARRRAAPPVGRSREPAAEGRGYFSYEGLTRVLHEKARLGILTAVRTRREGLLFVELKDLCSLTDGNLSRHLSVLQDAGLVEQLKGHQRGRPQTLVRMTDRGCKEYDAYLEELQRVIQDAQVRFQPASGAEKDLPPGFVAP